MLAFDSGLSAFLWSLLHKKGIKVSLAHTRTILKNLSKTLSNSGGTGIAIKMKKKRENKKKNKTFKPAPPRFQVTSTIDFILAPGSLDFVMLPVQRIFPLDPEFMNYDVASELNLYSAIF